MKNDHSSTSTASNKYILLSACIVMTNWIHGQEIWTTEKMIDFQGVDFGEIASVVLFFSGIFITLKYHPNNNNTKNMYLSAKINGSNANFKGTIVWVVLGSELFGKLWIWLDMLLNSLAPQRGGKKKGAICQTKQDKTNMYKVGPRFTLGWGPHNSNFMKISLWFVDVYST